MRISDWSSDVCSSDLPHVAPRRPFAQRFHGDGDMAGAAGRGGPGDEGGGRQHRLLVEAFAFAGKRPRSEEHTSELQSLLRTSYAAFCLKKKIIKQGRAKVYIQVTKSPLVCISLHKTKSINT